MSHRCPTQKILIAIELPKFFPSTGFDFIESQSEARLREHIPHCFGVKAFQDSFGVC